jgi:hypothetical protein
MASLLAVLEDRGEDAIASSSVGTGSSKVRKSSTRADQLSSNIRKISPRLLCDPL